MYMKIREPNNADLPSIEDQKRMSVFYLKKINKFITKIHMFIFGRDKR